MHTVVDMLSAVFDLLLKPLQPLPDIWSLAVVSVVAGVGFLKLFGVVSNQRSIRRVKDKIKANLFAVVIYRNNFIVSFGSILKMFGYNLLYLRYMLVPLVVLGVLFVLIYGQLDVRYGRQPVAVDEPFVVKLTSRPDADVYSFNVSLDVGLQNHSPALRIEQKNEIDWELIAAQAGTHKITVTYGNDQLMRIPISTGDIQPAKIASLYTTSWWERILYGGSKIPVDITRIEAVWVEYPERKLFFFGVRLHWVWIFLILSVAGGLAFKRFLRVEI